MVAVLLGDVSGFQGILSKVDCAAGLEEQLELGLAGEVAVFLGANLAPDEIGTENGLLDFDLEMIKVNNI